VRVRRRPASGHSSTRRRKSSEGDGQLHPIPLRLLASAAPGLAKHVGVRRGTATPARLVRSRLANGGMVLRISVRGNRTGTQQRAPTGGYPNRFFRHVYVLHCFSFSGDTGQMILLDRFSSQSRQPLVGSNAVARHV